MVKNRFKNTLKFFLKIFVSLFAIYIVSRKIEVNRFFQIIKCADLVWLVFAVLLFNLSKILSAFRLNAFFKAAGLFLRNIFNIRLYYVGMFYNLFLPGGIGGDGYKIYWLNKYKTAKLKDLALATLVDRISGLIALCFLFFVFFIILDTGNKPWITVLGWAALLVIYPAFWIIIKKFIAENRHLIISTNFHSLGVQLLQLVCALFILISLGVNDKYIEYQAVFLLSSVVAVLPFTIGGIGARELVFVQSAQILDIEINTAVAFSILFFVITAISSFAGIFFNIKSKDCYDK